MEGVLPKCEDISNSRPTRTTTDIEDRATSLPLVKVPCGCGSCGSGWWCRSIPALGSLRWGAGWRLVAVARLVVARGDVVLTARESIIELPHEEPGHPEHSDDGQRGDLQPSPWECEVVRCNDPRHGNQRHGQARHAQTDQHQVQHVLGIAVRSERLNESRDQP